jgi:hypothetical protein
MSIMTYVNCINSVPGRLCTSGRLCRQAECVRTAAYNTLWPAGWLWLRVARPLVGAGRVYPVVVFRSSVAGRLAVSGRLAMAGRQTMAVCVRPAACSRRDAYDKRLTVAGWLVVTRCGPLSGCSRLAKCGRLCSAVCLWQAAWLWSTGCILPAGCDQPVTRCSRLAGCGLLAFAGCSPLTVAVSGCLAGWLWHSASVTGRAAKAGRLAVAVSVRKACYGRPAGWLRPSVDDHPAVAVVGLIAGCGRPGAAG